MKYTVVAIALAIASFDASPSEFSAVIVVRHAEKADDGTHDPDLTAAGRERARALAAALAGTEISGLIASQYQRTRQTLAPLADRHGLEVTVVPAESGAIDSHIRAIVERVHRWEKQGVIVIAGHSNTVPMIVESLSGHEVAALNESDYDRLYVLLPGASGMEVIEARYGKSRAGVEP